MPSVRSIALGFWIRTGSRDEGTEQAGHLALPRAPAVQGDRPLQLARDRRAVRRDGGGGQRRHRQGDDLRLLALPRRAPGAGLRRAPGHGAAARLPGHRLRAPGGDRGDRDVRGRALGQGPRRAGRRDLRRPPAGPADHRPRRRDLVGAGAPDRASGTTGATCPTTSWSRPPATSTTTGSSSSWTPPSGDAGAADGLEPPVAQRRRRRCASTRRRPSSTTSASAGRGSRAATSAASRCACSTRSWAARPRRACSRRCARSAGWPTRSTRTRRSTWTAGQVALYVGTRPDNVEEAMEVIGTELRRLNEDGVTEAELERARENVKGRTVLAMESTLGAHEPAGQLGADGRAAADASTRCWRALDAVTLDDVAALARELWRAGAPVGRRRGGGRGRRSARRSRRSARRSPQRRDQRRGLRRGRADGRRPSAEAVEGADDMALVGRADPLLETALADVLGDADVVVDFSTPDTALANARACLEAGVHCVMGTTGADFSSLEGVGRGQPVRGPELRDRRGADDEVRRRGGGAHARVRDRRAAPRPQGRRPSGTAKRTAELIAAAGGQRARADPLGAPARPGGPPGGALRRRRARR